MNILVGDRFGVKIAELVADVAPVSWILNGIGRMQITLAKSDAKATETNLQVGNRVYIEFDNGLPVWGGVMDLPRRWTAGTVSVACYEIGQLLRFRETRKNSAFYERPVGSIFAQLLTENEKKDPMGITLGAIWTGGRVHWPRYHYKKLWNAFTDSLRKIEQCDFRFIPYVDSGRILFRAELYQVAGSDKTASVSLIEGGNVAAELTMEEQGEVVNVAGAVGAGSTWTDERKVVVARDSASVARYGLREDSEVYSDVSEVATLEMHARNTLSQKFEPRRIFSLPVTNTEPGIFAAYDLGDVVQGILPTFGFGGYEGGLRVMAREFNPATGACQVVVEEQRTAEAWTYVDEVGSE